MLLNVWTARWNGRLIEVRNHFFVAELLLDGERVDRVPGAFRHDLRGTLESGGPSRARMICSDNRCRHHNRPGARFCAKCGGQLIGHGATHEVHATVEAHFPPPGVACRILVDGDEAFKEGF
jgi:hypothetical protein